jgi:hypothetical protein
LKIDGARVKKLRFTSKRFPLSGANVSTLLKRFQSYLQSNHLAEDLVSLSLVFKQFVRIFTIKKASIENQSKVQTKKSEEKVQTVSPGQ